MVFMYLIFVKDEYIWENEHIRTYIRIYVDT